MVDRRMLTAVVTSGLCAVAPVGAAVFTVGPGGTHSTIQAAIDAAVAAGADNIIYVQQGTYAENLLIPGTLTSGDLAISGGWDALFNSRSQDPSLTVVDGQHAGTVLYVAPTGGRVEVWGLTLTNGTATSAGGGCVIAPNGPAQVLIGGCAITNNVTAGSGSTYGGGVFIWAPDGSHVSLQGSVVEANLSSSTGTEAFGGGIYLSSEGSASVSITANRIRSNTCHTDASSNSQGAGVYAYAMGTVSLEFTDNVVTGNLSSGPGSALYTGAYLGAWDTATSLVARRNLVWNNTSSKPDYTGAELAVQAFGASNAVLSDSVVAGSGGHGLGVQAYNTSQVSVVNVTVADVAGIGFDLQNASPQPFTQYNCVSWGNGQPDVISGVVTSGNNLTGVDPLFVDAATGNYQLAAGSPAIGYGNNAAPGLGTTDLYGGDRIIGTAVDAGAHERENVFADGMESGTPTRWSSSVY